MALEPWSSLCIFVQMQAGQENGGDLYAKRIPESATGGVALGPASAASAAVERAAALGGPRTLRCDLCQVVTDFVSASL